MFTCGQIIYFDHQQHATCAFLPCLWTEPDYTFNYCWQNNLNERQPRDLTRGMVPTSSGSSPMGRGARRDHWGSRQTRHPVGTMSAPSASTIPLFVLFAEPMPLQTSHKQPYVTTWGQAIRDIGITGVQPVKIEQIILKTIGIHPKTYHLEVFFKKNKIWHIHFYFLLELN